jgi:Arm DNA-binding domain
MPLTDVAIRSAKPQERSYKLADSQGMYFGVMPNGSKYWRLKYRVDRKEKRAALGVYPRSPCALPAREERGDQGRPVMHKKGIGEAEVPELMGKIAAYDGDLQTRLALQLLEDAVWVTAWNVQARARRFEMEARRRLPRGVAGHRVPIAATFRPRQD